MYYMKQVVKRRTKANQQLNIRPKKRRIDLCYLFTLSLLLNPSINTSYLNFREPANHSIRSTK